MTTKASELEESLIRVLREPPKVTVMVYGHTDGRGLYQGTLPGAWKVWRAHFLLGGGNSKKGGHVSQVTGPFDLTGHRLSDSSEHK